MSHRHCAFCLKEMLAKDAKLCGGCHRRAYCGKECQLSDWGTKNTRRLYGGNGQGHKVWCGIEYGEEDLDWEVVEIEGKGLGVKAKRSFPLYSRIMVEACQFAQYREESYEKYGHPSMQDLMPDGGNLKQKYELNHFGCGPDDGILKGVLCLRGARLNHDCDEMASHVYDKENNVVIIYAEKEISAGQEISISYQPFNDISTPAGISHQKILSMKWSIVCPDTCICRDAKILKAVNQCKKLDEVILRFARSGKHMEAFQEVKGLLQKMETLPMSAINKGRTLYDGFQIGIGQRRTLDAALEFLQMRYNIEIAIYHPKSAEIKQLKTFLENPRSHYNYLKNDR